MATPSHPSIDAAGWSAEWSNAVFPLEERDRRWAKVRKLMARDGIDLIVCLPCTNSHDRGQADARYLTQLGENSDEVTCAFPIEGEVTAWHSRGGVWPSSNWFKDIRAAASRGAGGATIAGWLRDNPRYQTASIAIAALGSTAITRIRAVEGEVNWQSVETLKREFPKARFVSASVILGEARWQKSPDEIEFIRKGAEIAETALQAVLKHARPGVRERHVFAQMMFANADAGGSWCPMVGWASGPMGRAYHRLEQPSFRTLQEGDVLALEIEGRWGGYIAQIDQVSAIGDPQPAWPDAAKLTWEAFNRVFEKLKPGVTVAELIETATFTGLNGRAKTGLGMHGRGLGDDGPLLVAGRPEPTEIMDIAINEACVFVVKPSVTVDGAGDYYRWGDSVVVTGSGAKRLGTRPQELTILK